jgi:vacuolar-type H+-ATPase subunit F/Vma7
MLIIIIHLLGNMIRKLKSKLLTKLFKEWVEDEWDMELLMMTATLIHNREDVLKQYMESADKPQIIGFGNKK